MNMSSKHTKEDLYYKCLQDYNDKKTMEKNQNRKILKKKSYKNIIEKLI